MSRQKSSTKTVSSLGEKVRNLREKNNVTLRKLASILDIDQSTLSKIERNERKLNLEMIRTIASIFHVEEKDLLVSYYSDIICYELEKEIELSSQILKVAEAKITYKIDKEKFDKSQ